MTKEQRLNLVRGFVLVAIIALTVFLFLIRDKISGLGAYGYPGIFLISIVANATVIVPLPGVLITSTMAAVFNPFWVAVAAGSGAALGELSGYLAGFSGQIVVEKVARYEKMIQFMRKYGDITILVLAFIPNPAFDLAGITAGALKMPLYRFLFWCALGKILKMLIFAYAGVSVLKWLS